MRISYLLKQILLGDFLLILILIMSFLILLLNQVNLYEKLLVDGILISMYYFTIKVWLPSWEKGQVGEAGVLEELKKLPSDYLRIADFHKGNKGSKGFDGD